MPISIGLHVKYPFYKKWNKKKSTIFFSLEIFTWYLEGKKLYPTNFLSQGAVNFSF